MANIAFDRHVDFCEKYITKMQETLSTLFREGPTKKCLEMSLNLADTRLAFRTWLTNDIQNKILPFEQALTKIAGTNIELEGLPVGEKRTRAVKEMHNTFADVLGLPRQEGRGKTDEAVMAGQIMGHLQDILGVKQLISLRISLVDQAVRTLEKND